MGTIAMDINQPELHQTTFTKRSTRSIWISVVVCLGVICIALMIALVVVTQNTNNKRNDMELSTSSTESENDVCLSKSCVNAANTILESINTEVDPCDDFFEYACGKWIKTRVFPDDKSALSVLHEMVDELFITIKNLLESSNEKETGAEMKAKFLYQSCINESAIELNGLGDILLYLNSIGGYPSLFAGGEWDANGVFVEDMLVEAGKISGFSPILEFVVKEDNKNPTINILYVTQGRLGMPDRQFLLKGVDDPLVQAYEKYATTIAVLLGSKNSNVSQSTRDVIDFEIQLANISVPLQNYNPTQMYHKMNVSVIQELFKPFNWTRYLGNIFSDVVSDLSMDIIIENPEYLSSAIQLIDKTPKEVVVNYIMLRIVQNLVDVLPQQFRRQKFQYEKTLRGIASELPTWRRCALFVNIRMPLSVGHLYIINNFAENSKDIVLKMIGELKKAMKETINSTSWMDETTKQKAFMKVDFIEPIIGYPDTVLNKTFLNEKYDQYDFKKDTLLLNEMLYRNLTFQEMISKIGKQVDTMQWDFPPAYVNAYYNPTKNQIVFPAGILQPPLFDRLYPEYLNFAGIGQIISHEITHGFDQLGSAFDEFGNLKQWWTSTSRTAFVNKLQCMVDQYNNYTVPEIDMKLNGNLTLGENIADNGGLKTAFKAFKSRRMTKMKVSRLPGVNLSVDQIFFLRAAHVWCGAYRPKEALKRLYSDNHSTFKYRVNGPLQNNEHFTTVFKCKTGSAMYRKEKCKVW